MGQVLLQVLEFLASSYQTICGDESVSFVTRTMAQNNTKQNLVEQTVLLEFPLAEEQSAQKLIISFPSMSVFVFNTVELRQVKQTRSHT